MEKKMITVQALVNAPVDLVWQLYNEPSHVTKWNAASEDWHSPKAENDLQTGGSFNYRMEAKDGSSGFDFYGKYDLVEKPVKLDITLGDDRKVLTTFEAQGDKTLVTTSFEAENMNPEELQQTGWQSILDNFKKYAEAYNTLERLHFEQVIHAPVEKVWEKMLGEEGYPQWTYIFSPGSYYEGSWDSGSEILFLMKDDKGNKQGMFSRIANAIPGERVEIEHLGVIKNGEKSIESPEAIAWGGAREIYEFVAEQTNQTKVLVDVDSNIVYKSYFEDAWPKALDKLKSIAES